MVATDAIAEEQRSSTSSPRLAELVQQRVHTKICGQSWVYQRVNKLERATGELLEAMDLTEAYPDPDNHAFGLKCLGRLKRMEAEELDVADPRRVELLDESAALLRRAHDEFTVLVDLGKTGFSEDHGECLSLLARTLATSGEVVGAQEAMVDAEVQLGRNLGSKGYADLMILRGDLELATREHLDSPQRGRVLANLLQDMGRLIEFHDTRVVRDGFAPSSSEIGARARVLMGRLHDEAGSTEDAHKAFTEAAELYEHLRYPGARDDAKWRAVSLAEAPLPEGLTRAFESLNANASDRLIALNEWKKHRSSPSAVLAPAPEDDNPIWAAVVRDAIRTRKGQETGWGEGRTA